MLQRLIVLISGRGSNLAALVQAARSQAWPVEVAAVISNRPEAPGLDWARSEGLPTEVLDHRAYPGRAAFDSAVLAACQAHRADTVVLAGFMRVLGEGFVRHYEGRLINIHPSLLPAFPGLNTHRRVLESGVKVSGASVHYVTPTLDHGPIIAQAVVPVAPKDTEATLAQRVLQAEHRLLPMAVGWHVHGELRLENGHVRHIHGAAQLIY